MLSESKDGAMIADHIKDVYYDRIQVELIFKEGFKWLSVIGIMDNWYEA